MPLITSPHVNLVIKLTFPFVIFFRKLRVLCLCGFFLFSLHCSNRFCSFMCLCIFCAPSPFHNLGIFNLYQLDAVNICYTSSKKQENKECFSLSEIVNITEHLNFILCHIVYKQQTFSWRRWTFIINYFFLTVQVYFLCLITVCRSLHSD